MHTLIKRGRLFTALLALVITLALSGSAAYAAKAARQISEDFAFGRLQKICVAPPVLELSEKAADDSLQQELLTAINRELQKSDLYLAEENASVKADATLQITLQKLEFGELLEPAHVNWHKQNNSVTLPTGDGKNATSIDLGVTVPEFVPEKIYPIVKLTAVFTLTDSATGEIIYRREQERCDRNTDRPGATLVRLVKEFHKDISKLIKQQAK